MAETSARLESLLGNSNHFIAVAAAADEKTLLGWIAAEERSLLVAVAQIEVMGLVVDHSAHRQGVGRALIAAVEQWTKERAVRCIVVRSNTRRQESHPFYEGLSYRREKSQHVYV